MTTVADLILLMPRYDGTSDSSTFVHRFTGHMTVNKKDPLFGLTNLGLFLDGSAKSWWNAHGHQYLTRYFGGSAADTPMAIWTDVTRDLIAAFPPSVTRPQAKENCRKRLLLKGEPAATYVNDKLALMNLWKPMDNDKQIDELIKGLPPTLSTIMIGAHPDSTLTFERILTRLLRDNETRQAQALPPTAISMPIRFSPRRTMDFAGALPSLSWTPSHRPPVPFRPQAQRPALTWSRQSTTDSHQPSSSMTTPSTSGQAVDFQQERKPMVTNSDGKPICLYCDQPGHFKRSCIKFAQDKPAESAALRQRHGDPPLQLMTFDSDNHRAFENPSENF
jgi:hypothetical protein